MSDWVVVMKALRELSERLVAMKELMALTDRVIESKLGSLKQR